MDDGTGNYNVDVNEPPVTGVFPIECYRNQTLYPAYRDRFGINRVPVVVTDEGRIPTRPNASFPDITRPKIMRVPDYYRRSSAYGSQVDGINARRIVLPRPGKRADQPNFLTNTNSDSAKPAIVKRSVENPTHVPIH
jgi:hypothetical protein